MTAVDVVIVPVLFGLAGFLEPCSLGVGMVFLGVMHRRGTAGRIGGAIAFVVVRAGVLAALGLSAAVLGHRLFTFEAWFFVALGVAYAAAGAWLVLGLARPRGLLDTAWVAAAVDPARPAAPVLLGLLGGLAIPACAIPLVTVLLGQSLVLGDAMAGFVALGLFGVTLSLPLLALVWLPRGQAALGRLAGQAARLRRVTGTVLVLVGLLTAASGGWWLGAAG